MRLGRITTIVANALPRRTGDEGTRQQGLAHLGARDAVQRRRFFALRVIEIPP